MTTRTRRLDEHQLMCVRNVNTYGIDPVWAECTCRFATETGTHAEMAAAFDAHTVAAGAGLVVTPWRVVAVPA